MAIDFKKKLEELKARQAQAGMGALAQAQEVVAGEEKVISPTEAIPPAPAPAPAPALNQNSPGFLLKQKVGELNEAMVGNHPRMPGLLKEIWLAIRKQPEQVTVLSPEETHTIFQGIERQTGVFLATSVVASKSSSGTSSKMAALKKLGADAF